MNRHTLQCIGTSTDGRLETKDSLVTQLNGACAGEPMPNESVHNESRPKAKPVHKAAGKDQEASKTTSTRCLKAKFNGRSSTGGHAISQVPPHKDERESGCGTVKQPGSAAQSQSPVSTGPVPIASVLRQTRRELRPSVAAEQPEVRVHATGRVAASCAPHPGGCVHSRGTSGSQAEHRQDQRPSEEAEEAEERSDEEGDEGHERSAPLELLAEFLKAVMEKDYPLSQKLCQMILIYEPENAEAKLFMPLIEERLLIAQEEEERRTREEDTGCSGEEDDDDEDDEDDDDSDSDEEDDEDSDDDDDADDGEEPADDSESSSSSSGEASDEDEDEVEGSVSEEQERCKRAVVIL